MDLEKAYISVQKQVNILQKEMALVQQSNGQFEADVKNISADLRTLTKDFHEVLKKINTFEITKNNFLAGMLFVLTSLSAFFGALILALIQLAIAKFWK